MCVARIHQDRLPRFTEIKTEINPKPPPSTQERIYKTMVTVQRAKKLIVFSLVALCNVLPGVIALPVRSRTAAPSLPTARLQT